jgi:hypothetical protein
MRLALRVLVLLLVFAGVAWLAAHMAIARAVAGTPLQLQVRLAAAMAALFAGGAAAVLVGIALLRIGRKR